MAGRPTFQRVPPSGAPSSVAFTSTEVGTVWRQWLRRDFGYTVGLQYYRNPYYKRAGVTVGVFFDF
jgi:YaiO family outer membrane protein